MKSKKEAYEWAKIPVDLPRENLVLITAKTTKTTIHPEDPEYPVRIFNPEQLAERASSLAQRPVGLNHLALITGAFTVDAQWNKKEQAIEALLFLPTYYINKVRSGEINKVSVEYNWRDEKRTEKGVEFEGFVFNRVDLLTSIDPGDSGTRLKLVEGKRGLMEGIIKMPKKEGKSVSERAKTHFKISDEKWAGLTEKEKQAYIKKLPALGSGRESTFVLSKELEESVDAYLKTLGEPFAGYKDFKDCVAKNKDKKNPEAYCGYIKHKVEDPKKKKKEGNAGLTQEQIEEIGLKVDTKIHKLIGEWGTTRVIPVELRTEAVGKIVREVLTESAATQDTSPTQPVEPVQTTVPAEQITEPVEPVTPAENPTAVVEPTNTTVSIIPKPVKPKPVKPLNDATNPTDTPPIQSTVPATQGTEPVEPTQATQSTDVLPTQPTQVTVPPTQATQVTTDIPPPDAKDVRIAELETAITKLQGSATTFEADKKKAVEDAEKKLREEFIENIEKALPPGNIISNFNRGGQVLAEDIRRILYKAKKGK